MKQRKEWVAPGDMPKLRVKPDLHPIQGDHDLCLVGLGGHGALGNARKECHSQQGALHSPATSCERGYSTEKTPSTRPNHTSS